LKQNLGKHLDQVQAFIVIDPLLTDESLAETNYRILQILFQVFKERLDECGSRQSRNSFEALSEVIGDEGNLS
jgi:hypothetical protein